LKRFGIPTSDDTILRHLKRRAKANRTGTSIRVVGLDDWASRKGSCVCRKPYPSWWSERIGYPGGMIALILFVLGILASPFKAKSRLEAENAALRQQLIVLWRKVKSRPRLANADRWFFVQLYRWFPSIPDVSPSSVRRRWCVGIGPAFVVIGSGNHGAEEDDRRFGQSCVR
jgi:hypothetical protein